MKIFALTGDTTRFTHAITEYAFFEQNAERDTFRIKGCAVRFDQSLQEQTRSPVKDVKVDRAELRDGMLCGETKYDTDRAILICAEEGRHWINETRTSPSVAMVNQGHVLISEIQKGDVLIGYQRKALKHVNHGDVREMVFPTRKVFIDELSYGGLSRVFNGSFDLEYTYRVRVLTVSHKPVIQVSSTESGDQFFERLKTIMGSRMWNRPHLCQFVDVG